MPKPRPTRSLAVIQSEVERTVAEAYANVITPQFVRALIRARGPAFIARMEDRLFPAPTPAANPAGGNTLNLNIIHGVPPSPLDLVEVPSTIPATATRLPDDG